jgi:NAD(P)-dependent dehydrogenase (short-subunit alcohol dehydrogenase family)
MKRNESVTWTRVDSEKLQLTGTRAAIVGGTGGLGRALSRLLSARGASVTVVGQTFRDAGVPGIEFLQADLSLMREARRVGQALPAETLDLLILTTGIFAAPARQETAEGLERDMAVSYLSRVVILDELVPRLGKDRPAGKKKPRVFIMGYPGAGQAGTGLDDLNAERSYSAMRVHMNTVAGNEMLVLDGVAHHPNALYFGLNPGLIKTNIRDNFLGKGSLKSRLAEGLIGLFSPSAESYAERILPLLLSPDLEAHSGALFDQKGQAVLPSPKLADGAHVSAFLAASEKLIERVLQPK